MNSTDVTVSNQEILDEVLLELANAEINELNLKEKFSLLSLFTKKVLETKHISIDGVQWLQNVLFKVCFQNYHKLNGKTFKATSLLVLKRCCLLDNLRSKGLKCCVDMLNDVLKLAHDGGPDRSVLKALNLTLSIVSTFEQKTRECEDEIAFKDIFKLCVQLLQMECINENEMVICVSLMDKVLDTSDASQTQVHKFFCFCHHLHDNKTTVCQHNLSSFNLMAIDECHVAHLLFTLGKEFFMQNKT